MPLRVLPYPVTVSLFSRAPVVLRSTALAVALCIATAGSGLPMCLSLVAQIATPCAMHLRNHAGATHEHTVELAALVAQAPGQACHPNAGDLGCAAGSACPTSGPAAPAWSRVPVALRTASRMEALGPAAALVSYLAPPLSPPPQA